MSNSKPFPAIHGGCFCGLTRYSLQSPPLFCYACHCQDCNKHTGSVFACFTSVEADSVSSIGAIPPRIVATVRPSGVIRHIASCGKCGTRLWAGGETPVTVDINTGSLDLPELMEPDLHSFIEGKISWVLLPEGAKTCKGPFDYREYWPKSSLKRLDAAYLRAQERRRAKNEKSEAAAGEDAEEEKEADKTPTAQTPEEKDEVVEDDEEFERRYLETEKALQQRLEQLSLRLNEHEKVKGDDLRPGHVQPTKEPPAATVSES